MPETFSTFSIFIGGILSCVVVVFHLQFSWLFKWESDRNKLSLINHRMFHTHHLALTLLILLIGLLSLFKAPILATDTQLAPWINAGYSLFWLWRALWQIHYFVAPPDHKKTILHYLLITLFILLSCAYAFPLQHILH